MARAELPPAGFVWLIDLLKTDSIEKTQDQDFVLLSDLLDEVLPPRLDVLAEKVLPNSRSGYAQIRNHHESWQRRCERRMLGVCMVGLLRSRKRAMARRLRASLVVAKAFDRFYFEEPPTPILGHPASPSPDLSPVVDILSALAQSDNASL